SSTPRPGYLSAVVSFSPEAARYFGLFPPLACCHGERSSFYLSSQFSNVSSPRAKYEVSASTLALSTASANTPLLWAAWGGGPTPTGGMDTMVRSTRPILFASSHLPLGSNELPHVALYRRGRNR